MNRQHQGILAFRIEVGRLDDPAVDAERFRFVPDLFHFAERDPPEYVGVHFSQARYLGWARQVESVDVAGFVRARDRPDRGAIVGERRKREKLVAFGELCDASIHRHEVKAAVPVTGNAEVEAASVRSPLHPARLTVVVARDHP